MTRHSYAYFIDDLFTHLKIYDASRKHKMPTFFQTTKMTKPFPYITTTLKTRFCPGKKFYKFTRVKVFKYFYKNLTRKLFNII